MEISERRIWMLAIAASLALHGLLLLCAPAVTARPPESPIMKVSLVAASPRAVVKSAVPAPAQAPAAKRQPAPAVVRRAAPATAKKSAVRPVQQPKAESKTASTFLSPKSAQPGEAASAQADGSGPGGGESAGGGSGSGSGSAGGGLAGGTGETVDVGTLVVTKKVLPDYPSFSRKRREEGTVKIIITIENGGVTKAEVEASSGYERLDASALRAVRQWRFDSPGTVRARVPFAFRLQ